MTYTSPPFLAHRVLAEASRKARVTGNHSLRRMVVSTDYRGLGGDYQVREGDILVSSGQTVVAVYGSIWEPEENQSLDVGGGCLVALEGGQVHGLHHLTGDVEVFRPTEV